MRACLVLWGTWLVVLTAVFSSSPAINSYYTAALSPAVAALIGTGLTLAWQHREQARTRLVVGVALLATAGYAAWLLPASGTGLPPWLKPALIGLALAAALSPAAAFCLAALTRPPSAGILTAVSITLSALAALIVPTVASASVVLSGLGPFETPFEPQHVTTDATVFFGGGFQAAQVLPTLEAANHGVPYLMATQTSVLAAPFIWASGQGGAPDRGIHRHDPRAFPRRAAEPDPAERRPHLHPVTVDHRSPADLDRRALLQGQQDVRSRPGSPGERLLLPRFRRQSDRTGIARPNVS